MDRQLYEEMTRNLEKLDREQGLTGRQIFLFGHCSAAEELADMLLDRGQTPAGFLDNNGAKHGKTYRGIKILPPQEVLARVQAGMRRCQKGRPMEEKLSYKRLVLYPEARKAVLAGKELALTAHEYDIRGLLINRDNHKCVLFGKELQLTPIEFSILWYLCERQGMVVSSEELFEAVWGEKFLQNNNTVMAHIGRLREKLAEPARNPRFIKTIWGVGYTIEK